MVPFRAKDRVAWVAWGPQPLPPLQTYPQVPTTYSRCTARAAAPQAEVKMSKIWCDLSGREQGGRARERDMGEGSGAQG